MPVTPPFGSPQDLAAYRQGLASRRPAKKMSISVCAETGCRAHGCMDVYDEFKRVFGEQRIGDVELRPSGCLGFCEQGPLVLILPQRILYCGVRVKDVPAIIEKTVRRGEVVESLLFKDPATGKRCMLEQEVPFYSKQQRVIFRNNGKMDPTDINDYLAAGGYTALVKVLTTMSPEDVINEVRKAGLRGRGGGGFPTGKKWEICRAQTGDEKYVIGNGDEGDPGAFMDRSIMEGNPFSVIEGMTIGAFAIGSRRGYLYVWAEYPLAVTNLSIALEKARFCGLLGENIMGTRFSFDVSIVRGAGAFVCGEETSLIASIQGEIGSPRQRPPYPA